MDLEKFEGICLDIYNNYSGHYSYWYGIKNIKNEDIIGYLIRIDSSYTQCYVLSRKFTAGTLVCSCSLPYDLSFGNNTLGKIISSDLKGMGEGFHYNRFFGVLLIESSIKLDLQLNLNGEELYFLAAEKSLPTKTYIIGKTRVNSHNAGIIINFIFTGCLRSDSLLDVPEDTIIYLLKIGKKYLMENNEIEAMLTKYSSFYGLDYNSLRLLFELQEDLR